MVWSRSDCAAFFIARQTLSVSKTWDYKKVTKNAYADIMVRIFCMKRDLKEKVDVL